MKDRSGQVMTCVSSKCLQRRPSLALPEASRNSATFATVASGSSGRQTICERVRQDQVGGLGMAEKKCTAAVSAGRLKKAREFRLAAELVRACRNRCG